MSLVLVADDEPAVLEVLSDVVEDLGHRVVKAKDGREALAVARAHLPNLVVTDHMMPRLTGVDLCRQLREDAALKDVPVILLSAALAQGIPEAQAFLPKPFELTDFERLVESILARGKLEGSPSSEPLAQELDTDHLINSVAHEIRTPLAAARLNLQLLERSLGSEAASQHGYARSLGRQLTLVDAMVNALLDASRIADGKLHLERERIDLCGVVSGWVERRRPIHGELELDFQPQRPVIEVGADGARIRQILDAILASVARYGATRRKVVIAAESNAQKAVLRVSDTRLAAAPERAEPAAVPAEAGRTGAAIELYVASQLARLHGGELIVRAMPEGTAVYTLELPR